MRKAKSHIVSDIPNQFDLHWDDHRRNFFEMHGTAIVDGKVVRFELPPALAKAHKRNARTTMTDQEAINFVESRRRELALRRARPYLEDRS